MSATPLPAQQGKISFDRAGDATLMVHLSGPWHLRRDLPPADLVIPELQKQPAPKRLSFDTSSLTGWDSGLVSFLLEVEAICRAAGHKRRPRGVARGSQAPDRAGRGGAGKRRRPRPGEEGPAAPTGRRLGARLQRRNCGFSWFFRRPLGGAGQVRDAARPATVPST